MLLLLFIAYIIVLSAVGIHLSVQLTAKNAFMQILSLFFVFLIINTVHSAANILFFSEHTEIHRASPFGFVYGPFLYFAFFTVEHRKMVSAKRMLLHLLPALLWTPIYLYFLFQAEWRQENDVLYHIVLYSGVILSVFAYSIYCFIRINRLREISATGVLLLSISTVIFFIYGVYLVMVLYQLNIKQNELNGQSSQAFIYCIRALACSFVFYKVADSFLNDVQSKTRDIGGPKPNFFPIQEQDSYRNSLLTVEQLKTYSAQLEKFLMEEQGFRRPTIGLAEVARELKINQHHLTQLLSRAYRMGLVELINRLRVEYACDLLRNSSQRHVPLADIFSQCGFSSENTFFRNFKTIKSITPTQYRQKFGK